MTKQWIALITGVLCSVPGWATEHASIPSCSGAPRMSLTFDDGPMGWKTQNIVDILDTYQVRATFFVVGRQVRAHQDLLQDMEARGHELAVHTYTHPNLGQLSSTARISEIQKTVDVLQATVHQPIVYWRAPYGVVPRDTSFARQYGLSHVSWSIDSKDYLRPSKEVQIQRVVSQFHPGAIILFHDHAPSTWESLPEIIVQAQAQGYEWVPVHELLHPAPCSAPELLASRLLP